jgi:hypothetical protein
MNLNKISITNLIFSIFELLTFFVGIERFSGGCCNYWKCQTVFVSLWLGLVMVHCIVNIMFLLEVKVK